ncbi:hypothetical protein KO317_03160 [Candidatus Micrarchaeota archaeon]|jgi:hypothetical protein|nr:hypothetical protein [Candidatus Micrarchaeota archaeon]
MGRIEKISKIKSKRKIAKIIFEKIKNRQFDVFYDALVELIVHPFLYNKENEKKMKSVLDLEWDNLIILDACRWDTFCKVFGKEVPYIFSKGSSTPEWLVKNFNNKKLEEVIYISSNPYVEVYVKDSFYKIFSLWLTNWNEEIGTVMPEEVTENALKIHKKYPNKKLIIHYMQPHYPFIGHQDLTPLVNSEGTFYKNKVRENPWTALAKGKLTEKEVWDAYEDNLKVVLPGVLNLAKNLKGKTIISADHGNMYKKIKFPPHIISGHIYNFHHEDLIKVPWYEANNIPKELDTEKERISCVLNKLKLANKI